MKGLSLFKKKSSKKNKSSDDDSSSQQQTASFVSFTTIGIWFLGRFVGARTILRLGCTGSLVFFCCGNGKWCENQWENQSANQVKKDTPTNTLFCFLLYYSKQGHLIAVVMEIAVHKTWMWTLPLSPQNERQKSAITTEPSVDRISLLKRLILMRSLRLPFSPNRILRSSLSIPVW